MQRDSPPESDKNKPDETKRDVLLWFFYFAALFSSCYYSSRCSIKFTLCERLLAASLGTHLDVKMGVEKKRVIGNADDSERSRKYSIEKCPRHSA
jgi:hypothetical protein